MIQPDVAGCVALVLVVLAGCIPRVQVSVLAPVVAFCMALWAGQGVAGLAAAFPLLLAFRLVAVTSLFAMAMSNGTIERLAWLAVRIIRYHAGLAGPLFFLSALVLASSGSGNFAAASMLVPVAMGVTRRLGIKPFLMSVMVVYGATAGAFSPVAPTGIVASMLMVRGGIPHSPWVLFLSSLAAHSLVALVVYILARAWRRSPVPPIAPERDGAGTVWTRDQVLTSGILGLFILLGVSARLPLELLAGGAALALVLLRTVKGLAWIATVPWRLIGTVCGVSMLAAVVEQAGGMSLLGRVLAATGSPEWLPAELAFLSGLVSVSASSVGVVLPAFLPVVSDIVHAAGGGSASAIAYSINVGAHLVDISPLSPLGALCVAYEPATGHPQLLFGQLMRMGLAMCFLGAILCQLLFASGLFA